MPPRKKLASAIQNVLIKIDLDAPVVEEQPKEQKQAAAETQATLEPTLKNIRDIIGDLSLDLD